MLGELSARQWKVPMTAHDHVILVDEHDRSLGTEEKMSAHRAGRLHRAFSIFVFHPDGRVMLQQRALSKYHSGGLWTNTCCSHPRPEESTDDAAHRRLGEEMGFDCVLRHVFAFVYRAELDHGLTEHEYDHVYVGTFNGEPRLNVNEAAAWRWITTFDLDREMTEHPETFTVWSRIAWKELRARDILDRSPV
jgi:isopentenyl-diphosphate delta-isomerase